ncbi:MAG: flagellar protein FlgN [Calditrichia bacterium]
MKRQGRDQNDWVKAISLLKKIVQDNQALLRLIEQKREVLLRGDVKELRQIAAKEEGLLVTLSTKLRDYRDSPDLPGAISSDEAVQLSKRFSNAPPEVKKAGEENQQELSKVVSRINFINRQNRDLLRVSMEVTGNVLDALNPMRHSSTMYESSGNMQYGIKKGILDKIT